MPIVNVKVNGVDRRELIDIQSSSTIVHQACVGQFTCFAIVKDFIGMCIKCLGITNIIVHINDNTCRLKSIVTEFHSYNNSTSDSLKSCKFKTTGDDPGSFVIVNLKSDKSEQCSISIFPNDSSCVPRKRYPNANIADDDLEAMFDGKQWTVQLLNQPPKLTNVAVH
ncbi:hypothetical protein GJ496_009948 [Pomphorhynchus laevis]|nr:hypothetical protein GJ496_009948 [Pomphorhynchus laevis]